MPELTGINLTSSNTGDLTLGSVETITVSPVPAKAELTNVKITNSNPEIVVVRDDGFFKYNIEGMKVGSTTIKAKVGSIESSPFVINVVAP